MIKNLKKKINVFSISAGQNIMTGNAIKIIDRALHEANNRNYTSALKILQPLLNQTPQDERISQIIDIIRSKKSEIYNLKLIKKTDTHILSNIESPLGKMKSENLSNFHLRGWVSAEQATNTKLVVKNKKDEIKHLTLNSSRPDVTNYLNKKGISSEISCGFSHHLNLHDTKAIGCKLDKKIHWLYDIEISKTLQVIEGEDGWLFLDNDSNRSVDQYTGKVTLLPQKISDWNNYASKVKDYMERKKINFNLLISPSKESALEQYYPHKKAPTTITDDVINILKRNNFNFTYSLSELKNNQLSYYKTDTHWSHLGAWLSFREVLLKLGIKESFDKEFNFRFIEAIGDLGSKLTPPQKSLHMIAGTISNNKTYTFDNKVIGTGNITHTINNSSLKDSKIIIFGGSSSNVLRVFLYKIFRETIIINCPAILVKDVIEQEKPDYVLLQTNERYLTTPPRLAEKLEDLMIYKSIRKSSLADKKKLLESIEVQEHKKSRYYNIMKEIIKA